MKVLLVNNLYAPMAVGGAERSVQSLAEGLTRSGYEVAVCTLGPETAPFQSSVNGVEVYRLPLANLYWPDAQEPRGAAAKLLWHAWDTYNPIMDGRIQSVLADFRPDLVHTHNLSGFSVVAMRATKRNGIPLVHTFRDYYLICPRNHLYRNGRLCGERRCGDCRALSAARISVARNADALVGISRYILDRHLAANLSARTGAHHVIYNGIDGWPSPPDGHRQPADGAPLKLGYLGRLHPTKGVHLLIELLANTQHLCPTELFVAGQGPADYVDQLKAMAVGAKVTFLGQVAPQDLFDKIHFLVVPSLWPEPFGRIVIESYAQGTPVIAASRGGLSELVDDATGFLFDPDSPDDLAETLGRADEARGRLAGFRSACLGKAKLFSVDTMIGAHLDLYQDVVRNSHRTRQLEGKF